MPDVIGPVQLRTYFESQDGLWQAICVDLDIAAQGTTLTETQKLMDEMISSYLRSLFKYPPEQRKAFLNRKAPLHVRLRLAFKFFISSTFTNRATGDKVSVLSHHSCPA